MYSVIMICGSNYNYSNTRTKGKIKVFTNIEYVAICYSHFKYAVKVFRFRVQCYIYQPIF